MEYAKQMEENGAGELLVTSMDRDGTQVGYDIDLMSKISSKVNIPSNCIRRCWQFRSSDRWN